MTNRSPCPWTRRGGYGLPRLVRDLLTVAGAVEFGPAGGVARIWLNESDSLARRFLPAFQAVVGPEHDPISLGQT
jgi:hypothetical protein